MQNAFYIKPLPLAIPQAAKPSPTQQLERARKSVQGALRAAADEAPSFALLDDISRALTAAMRELDGLAITVAVLSRKEAKQ